MILDRITLFDFGLYGGQQVIDLSPASDAKPVVLLGGMNGGGKTTLLDAINLVLYGVRAQTSNRNGANYPDYLRACINRKSRDKSAWIELAFRHRSEGVDNSYVVTRSWKATDATTREDFEVRKNGRSEPALEQAWADHVEGFLPLGLSRLFLFDGEQIETLAHSQHAQQALETAMGALLGLDVVDQLCLDLKALENKKRTEQKSVGDRAEIDALQGRISDHANRLSALVERRAQLETEVDQRTKRVLSLEEDFRRRGGDAFQGRETLRAEASGLEMRIQAIESALAEEAIGVLPLLLVKDLLESVEHQANREEQAVRARNLVTVLEERDQNLLGLVDTRAGKKVAAELSALLKTDRDRRLQESSDEAYLGLSAEAAQILTSTLSTGIPECASRAQRMKGQLRDLQDALVQVERKLQSVPDEEAIRDLIEVLERARIQVQLAQEQRDALVEEVKEVERLQGSDAEKLARLVEKSADDDAERDGEIRVATYALKSRTTLKDFRTAVVRRHVGRIELLVMECFRHLLRKQGLIESARIDPQTFAVELRNKDGDVVPADRLSAGERQLFAVSLLWGLARASGRSLPTVIDTPLGRLDGTHREHLVQRYFPTASKQVILLSTDKEIDQEYYRQLKPFIGREYTLEYDEAAQRTTVRKGYFW